MILNGRKIKDITGLRSGKLVAIKPVMPQERYGDTSRKVILWECQCDCGNKTVLRTSRITGQDIKSCGCKSICGRRKRGYKLFQYGKDFKNYQGVVPLWYCARIKRDAKKRNINFDLTPNDMNDVFVKQNKKCIFTNLDLKFGETTHTIRKETTASLDRIDSSIGYIKGNIQWVHKDVNLFKGTMTNVELVNICCKLKDMIVLIAENRKFVL